MITNQKDIKNVLSKVKSSHIIKGKDTIALVFDNGKLNYIQSNKLAHISFSEIERILYDYRRGSWEVVLKQKASDLS